MSVSAYSTPEAGVGELSFDAVSQEEMKTAVAIKMLNFFIAGLYSLA